MTILNQMKNLNLAIYNYTSYPFIGSEVLLNKVWKQGRILRFQTIHAKVLEFGPKRMRVRTHGHKTHVLFVDPNNPHTVYTNPKRVP